MPLLLSLMSWLLYSAISNIILRKYKGLLATVWPKGKLWAHTWNLKRKTNEIRKRQKGKTTCTWGKGGSGSSQWTLPACMKQHQLVDVLVDCLKRIVLKGQKQSCRNNNKTDRKIKPICGTSTLLNASQSSANTFMKIKMHYLFF